MSVGKQGSAQVTVSYKDAGGVARTMTAFITSINGLKITQPMELVHAMGDAWEKSAPSGVGKVDPVKMGGYFDNTATTGPHAVFGTPDSDPNGATRTLAVVVGSGGAGGTFTVETRLMDYAVTATLGKLTKFEATAQPTAAPVWS